MRHGGEAFAVILPRSTVEGGRTFAERVREALALSASAGAERCATE